MLGIENQCIFCGIVQGEQESSTILETDRLKVITALEGGYPLIITKKHIKDWGDPNLDEETAKEIVDTQIHLVRAVMATPEVGVSIISNNRKVAGQTINHLHVHIMPRRVRDGLVRFEPGEKLDRNQLDCNASVYRNRLVALGLI